MQVTVLLVALITFMPGSLAGITGTNPSSGACLCVSGTGVKIRSSPCGSEIRKVNTGLCYQYQGAKRTCRMGGRSYEFFKIGSSSWMAGDYLNVASQSFCTGTSSASASGNCKGEYCDLDLTRSAGLTAQQIDQWINSKTQSRPTSVMRGKGAVFVQAARESGLNVRYLVAHAASETAWGTSRIAKEKRNMYGIRAYDRSPRESASSYSTVDEGIIEGAKWIATHFVNRGQNTIRKMRWNNGVHEYATDTEWDNTIAKIMAGGPR